jgi:cytochrome c-type biogenesis protein CcmH
MIWVLFTLMTITAVVAALWPLLRNSKARPVSGGSDVAVYRDQLEEIERDRAAGLIGAAEAEAARVEVSRRLIAAAEGAGPPGPTRHGKAQQKPRAGEANRSAHGSVRQHRLAAAITLGALPLGTAGLYLALGSPDLPRLEASALVAAENSDAAVESAFARIEAHLQQHPEDGRGWEVIAPVYMRLGRYDDAVKARTNAVRLLGVTAEREADLGEALVAAANGVVTAEAKAVFDDAIRLDPRDVSARFYQGLAAEQDGDRDAARRLWQRLLADASEGAPWTDTVRRALARLDSPRRDSDSPMGAAANAETQDQMIRGMVERLAARLHQDGSDADGWLRLVRSYHVLGDLERARQATAEAQAALASDADKLRRFNDGLKGIESEAKAGAVGPSATGSPIELASTAGHDAPSAVERLAARMHQNGSDPAGWLMLVRSYRTLGDAERARGAIADARAALTNDPEKLSQFEKDLQNGPAGPTASTPTSSNRGAASAESGQDAMIRGMVERLAARLQQDGSDVEGWLRLVRSYHVLKDPDRARTAAADAHAILANDPEKLRRLDEDLKTIADDTAAPTVGPAATSDKVDGETVSKHDPQSMVERLAARLERDGSDVEGWLTLARSYAVLGDPERSSAALAGARRALAKDPDKLRRLDEGIKSLSLKEGAR